MMKSKTNSYRGFNGQYTDLVIPSHRGQKTGSIKTGKENIGFGKTKVKREENWGRGGEEETVKEEEAIYSTIRTRYKFTAPLAPGTNLQHHSHQAQYPLKCR